MARRRSTGVEVEVWVIVAVAAGVENVCAAEEGRYDGAGIL